MSFGTRVTAVGGAAILLVFGCDDVRGDACVPEDDVEARGLEYNGVNLNGVNLNGVNLNGVNLNGVNLNGVNLNSPRLNATDGSGDYIATLSLSLKGNADAENVWLTGSKLSAKTKQGVTMTGDQLNKAKLEFESQEGGVVNKKNKGLKIRGVRPLAPGSDVWVYDIDIKIAQGGWRPLCSDHNGEPTEAILLTDVWESGGGRVFPRPQGALTFACRDAALAKCVEYGYRPWASVNGQSLAELHQACTRMVRADYCGDGQSHTANGTPIHVLDQVGIQTLANNASFAVEAEWGPDGAVCVNPQNMRLGGQSLSCQLPTCAASFASGGLIQSGKIVAGP